MSIQDVVNLAWRLAPATPAEAVIPLPRFLLGQNAAPAPQVQPAPENPPASPTPQQPASGQPEGKPAGQKEPTPPTEQPVEKPAEAFEVKGPTDVRMLPRAMPGESPVIHQTGVPPMPAARGISRVTRIAGL